MPSGEGGPFRGMGFNVDHWEELFFEGPPHLRVSEFFL